MVGLPGSSQRTLLEHRLSSKVSFGRKLACATVGALLGAFFAPAMVKILDATSAAPSFPTFGGEDDFSIRFWMFAGIVVPAFLLLGAWVGLTTVRPDRSWLRATVGAVVGSLVACVVGRMAVHLVAPIASRGAANRAVLIYFIGWTLLGVAGAVVFSRRRSTGPAALPRAD